jgi:hypothetical protein
VLSCNQLVSATANRARNVHINDGSKPPVFRSVGLYRSALAGYTRANVRLGGERPSEPDLV